MNINVVYEECPPGWLRPGDKYNIPVVPDRVISNITVTWEDVSHNASGTLYIDNSPFGTAPIPDVPNIYTWSSLNYTTTISTEAFIEISGGCAHIISVDVLYVEDWVPLYPGQSYPFPSTAADITSIALQAKTDLGSSSTLEFIFVLFPLIYHFLITELIVVNSFTFSPPYPVSLLLLTNIGSSVIYIKLITE